MDVETLTDGSKTVQVFGEVDLSNVDQLKGALDSAADTWPGGFTIDLSGVPYIDSAGIQAILSVYQRMRRTSGELTIVLGNTNIREIFDIIHLEEFPGITVR